MAILAPALPPRDELAADFADERESDVFILPPFIASRRSRFITRYESAAAAAIPEALAESVRADWGEAT